MRITEAELLARSLMAILHPQCDRMAIAGSVRRRKPEVKDIEIVAIPLVTETFEQRDLFGEIVNEHIVYGLDQHLEFMVVHGGSGWIKDKETPRWGDRYKRLWHMDQNIACDLFITDTRRWAYTLAIRTGPAARSKEIVTEALRRGWHFEDCLLHLHHKARSGPCPDNGKCPKIQEFEEEADLLAFLGIPEIEIIDARRTGGEK